MASDDDNDMQDFEAIGYMHSEFLSGLASEVCTIFVLFCEFVTIPRRLPRLRQSKHSLAATTLWSQSLWRHDPPPLTGHPSSTPPTPTLIL